MPNKFVVLIIRDGWGLAPAGKYNAVTTARKPVADSITAKYPHCILDASGEAVGLPPGYQGSSEVGHLNMGAGRIVEQELKRIMDAMEDNSLFSAPPLKRAVENCVSKGAALHVMGLVQDEGVHAHQEHLFAIMKHAKQKGIKTLHIHFFADGRDTPPRSALGFLKEVELKINEIGIGKVSTLMGRYYAMDRGEKWELVDKAYNALTKGDGLHADTAEKAITDAYESRNPDGSEMSDEYIPPTIIGDFKGIADGDSVIHFNYRQDRAIELTKAFIEDDYPGKRWKKLNVVYCGFTRYYDTFKYNALPPMDEGGDMGNLLGEVISRAGLKQLRISETQKFKHVTSFFNGKLIKPYPGEERIEIKSRFDPSSFAEHPEMNARDVAERAVREILSRKYSFVLVNFANCDMVGHTGSFDAAVRAVEIVDECVGKAVEATLAIDGCALVTSDHGNAEEMWDERLEMPKTSHTCNPVDFTFVSSEVAGLTLRERGILSDIAPTVLELLGIPKPDDMTAQSLLLKTV